MKFEKTATRTLALAAVVLLVLGLGLALSAGGVVRISAGPATSASDVLAVDEPAAQNPDTTTSPLVTTVRAVELTKWEALVCALKTSCDTMVLEEDLSSSASADQMADSVDQASKAANTLLGGGAAFPEAPGTGLAVRGVGGPSAGLTLGLHFVNVRSRGDLFAAHKVAATGTLEPDGAVGPVGGVKHKATGATRAGVDVLFVPRAEAGEARASTAPQVDVVPVSSLVDAVTWLCDNGATSTVCR